MSLTLALSYQNVHAQNLQTTVSTGYSTLLLAIFNFHTVKPREDCHWTECGAIISEIIVLWGMWSRTGVTARQRVVHNLV